MLCNLSLWGITTFEMQKPIHNPQQLDFYGAKAWTIFVHISGKDNAIYLHFKVI
jgi:hypothetical protein